ncbi:MAG: phosphoribosyl-ATP diphosphatase [Gammaproteobacteria bacterium]|jgi:phosphoribosyl-ATP pyrophosphohydrolase|nr:phosphoribosyl-ATP diphosphatase [Gammaproteobacteria bacterium]
MPADIIDELYRILEERKTADPRQSYVAGLYADGVDHILKKIGEEATELVISGKAGSQDQIIRETADLWFHSLVLLAYKGISSDRVMSELERRFGQSGLEEKASRQQQ